MDMSNKNKLLMFSTFILGFPALATVNTGLIHPTGITLCPLQQQQFTLSSSTEIVTWPAHPIGMGTITTSGLYTAGASSRIASIHGQSAGLPSLFVSTVYLSCELVAVAGPPGPISGTGFGSVPTNPVTKSTSPSTGPSPPSPSPSPTVPPLPIGPSPGPTASPAVPSPHPTRPSPLPPISIGISISITPVSISVQASQSAQFTALVQSVEATSPVSGATNTAVTWSLIPAVGSITNGVYQAPAVIGSEQSLTVTATSVANPTKAASATVSLIPPFTVTSMPPFQLVASGDAELFLPNSAFHCQTPSMQNEPPEPKIDGPDAPVVFFRDANGLIHMFVAGGFNFAFTGSTFYNLTQDCNSVYLPHWNSDPLQYQYAEWLRSPYSIDGIHVYGVVHDEYHCATANPSLNISCAYEALTQVTSTDGGNTFNDEPMPQRLVATIPYQVLPSSTTGVGDNSNIIHNPDDGYYYMEAVEHSNGVGPCMLRSSDLLSWYAWDGTSFSVLMNDPTAYNKDVASYSCAAIFAYPLGGVGNIRYLPEYALFLGVGSLANSFYYVVCTDLVNWSAPVFLFPANTFSGLGTWQIGEPLPVAYGDLIDPDSSALNFDVVSSGDSLYLYLVRTHTYVNSDGVAALDNSNRDIIRYPLILSSSAAPRPAAAPTFSMGAGSYSQAETITLSCSDSSAAIYFTTNGSAPAASPSLSTLYSGPVAVSTSQTISAICVAANYGISPPSSAKYTITSSGLAEHVGNR